MPPYDAAPHRVFLKHLYMGVTEKQLMDELEKADASKGLYFVKLNKQGLFDANRSINCFLSYETAEQVRDAIQKLHGHMLSGLAKFPLEADVAYPRARRKLSESQVDRRKSQNMLQSLRLSTWKVHCRIVIDLGVPVQRFTEILHLRRQMQDSQQPVTSNTHFKPLCSC